MSAGLKRSKKMIKVSNIIHILPKDDVVKVISADAVTLAIKSAESIISAESNLMDLAMNNSVVCYDYDDNLHTIYTDGRFEDLPKVKNLLPFVSGVKTIGVHLDDCCEISTPEDLMLEYGNNIITYMHICEKDMCDNFNIELWLA